MSRTNPTELAILGLLAEEARSGYDIKKEVEGRLGHFWSESYGHIYPMLRRLLDRGLVGVALERQDGKPDRKVYSLTEAGRSALAAGFVEPPATQRPRNELLLRIFLGRHAPVEHLLRDVRARRDQAAGTLEALHEIRCRLDAERVTGPDRAYWDLTLDYGFRVLGALVAWAEAAEAELERISESG